MDVSVRDRLDVISASGPIEARSMLPYFRAKLPVGSNSRIQYRQTVIEWGGTLLGSAYGDEEDGFNEHTRNLASSRLQLWYRALLSSRRAAVQWLSLHSSTNPPESELRWVSVNKILFMMASSELKISYSLKQSIVAMKIKQIHGIIDEVVEEALIRCMRFEAAQRCIMNDTLQSQNQTPDRGERRNAMDNSFLSPTSSTTSYVSGGLKSMAAMAGGLKSMVTDTVSGGGPTVSVRNGTSSDRLVSLDSGAASPHTPGSKKTLSKKLFSMMTGGMLEKEKQKEKYKDLVDNRESIDEASV